MTAIGFLPEAEDEFLAEVEYYSQARSGLGVKFQAAVELAIGRIAAYPLAGAPLPDSLSSHIRSVRVQDFPFRLVYRIDPDQLLVVAVAHNRRQANYWAQRLE